MIAHCAQIVLHLPLWMKVILAVSASVVSVMFILVGCVVLFRK